ncbi:retrotransposon protein, putative, ty1-copia subclass [Tanacetum coccineum]
MLEKHQLTGPNFNELFRALKLVVRTEKLHDVFETALPPAPAAGADAQALAEGQSVSDHVLLMKSYLDQLAALNYAFPDKVSISFILNSLSSKFQAFMQNYNMQSIEKIISEVHSLLIEFEKSIKRNKQPIVGASSTLQVMAIQGGRVQKYKPQGKAKGKGKGKGLQNSYPTKPKKPQPYKKKHPAKDGQCHHCKEEGHWKMNCLMYLAELMKKKKKTEGQNVASTSLGIYTIELFAFPKNSWVYDTGCGTHICNTKQGLRGAKKLKRGSLYLYMGNGVRAEVEAIRSFDLVLPNESAARILNMVPTKKVDKTPYELWHGKVPNLSYLKVWGCEAHVKRHTPDKLQQRSVKYFLEKDFILQKESGRIVELEDEDILPSENTSEHPIEEESLALIVSQERINLSGILEFEKWVYKKETNMDGKFTSIQARLIAKGLYSKLMVFDYEETFSPVADIRAIRILIAIAAFYDYEIWQMDNVPYASVVGSIMYDVRCTRPDVAFVQNITSRFQQNSGEAHWTAVKNILKRGGMEKLQNKVLLHSMPQAEYIAASEACLDDNLADPFTKALAGPKLTRHARSMGLRPASSFIIAKRMVALDLDATVNGHLQKIVEHLESIPKLQGENIFAITYNPSVNINKQEFRKNWLLVLMIVISAGSFINIQHLEKETISTGKEGYLKGMLYTVGPCANEKLSPRHRCKTSTSVLLDIANDSENLVEGEADADEIEYDENINQQDMAQSIFSCRSWEDIRNNYEGSRFAAVCPFHGVSKRYAARLTSQRRFGGGGLVMAVWWWRFGGGCLVVAVWW